MTMQNRCKYEGCLKRITIIGYCNHCKMDYCMQHRLTELHECKEYNKVEITKKQGEIIMSGKCVSDKLMKI